jgi:hypothetical protein
MVSMLSHRLFVLSLTFTVFIQATLVHVGIPNSRYIVSYISFIIVAGFIFLRARRKQIRPKEAISIIIIFCIGMSYSLLSAINYGILSGAATFKTFFAGILFVLFLILSKRSIEERVKFHKFILDILLIISSYTIAEFLLRSYYPPLFNFVTDFVRPTQIAGLSYLRFGGGWGIQPIGIFFDMHTHTSVFTIAALLAFIEKKKLLFVISIIALILAFRSTSFVGFFLGFLILVIPKNIFLLFSPIFPYLVILFAESLPGKSWSIIKSHVYNNFSQLFNRGEFAIIFGEGYDNGGIADIIGYNELFIVNFIFIFGFIGLLLLAFFSIYIHKAMKSNSTCRYDRLSSAMILTIPIHLFHYNIFFQPFVVFLYLYIAFHVASQRQLGYFVYLPKIKAKYFRV